MKPSEKAEDVLYTIAVIVIVAVCCWLATGCGLLAYTPQQRDMATKLNVLGNTWEWTSKAKALPTTCPKCGADVAKPKEAATK